MSSRVTSVAKDHIWVSLNGFSSLSLQLIHMMTEGVSRWSARLNTYASNDFSRGHLSNLYSGVRYFKRRAEE